MSKIEQICMEKGIKMTPQRRLIARILLEADDHPDIEVLHQRATLLESRISLATVYRTINIFESCGVVKKLEIKDGKARYETVEAPGYDHHHHLIDLETGQIIEFRDCQLEALKVSIAENLGYNLIDHRLELYGVKIKNKK